MLHEWRMTVAIRHHAFASRRGFTLIEMILAISISATVLIVVNSVFFSALRLRDDTTDMVDAASPVDAAVTFIKRDLQCVVTTTNGTSKMLSGGFRAGNALTSVGVSDPVAIELVTASGAFHDSEPWADLQRVTYELKAPAPRRARPGPVSERHPESARGRHAGGEGTAHVNGVASLKFSCYDGAQWNDTWDTNAPTAVYTNLPVAVRVNIQMAGRADLGPIELVVPVDCVPRTNAVLTATGS